MSNNTTAGFGGSILGMVSLFIQQVQVQTAVEVFIYGVIGGIAGVLGKMIIMWILRKIKQLCLKKQKKDE